MSTDFSHRQSIKYLRDEAIRGHLDGQGAKARHLSALALHSVINSANPAAIQFKDIAWAFALLIYWLLDEVDYILVLKQALEKYKKEKKKKSETDFENLDEHWYTLICFLLNRLNPYKNKWDEDIQFLEKIPREFFQGKMDQQQIEALSLILNLTLCFIFSFSQRQAMDISGKRIWNSLALKWLQFSEKDLRPVFKMLKQTRGRLEEQEVYVTNSNKILFSGGDDPDGDNNILEKFWKAFYNLQVKEMQDLHPKLVQLVHDDTDKFYPVQGLINMSSIPKKKSFFGFYRIQRLYMENPQWLFNRLRRIKFYEILNDLRYKASQDSMLGSDFDHLWKLSLLTEITSLQNWDLATYLYALKMQSEASLFWGLFPVDFKNMSGTELDTTSLKLGIFNAVKGLALHNTKNKHFKDIGQALLYLEIQNNGRAEIESLVFSLIKSRKPIEYYGLVRVFSILSDALPQKSLEDVVKISTDTFLERSMGWDMKLLNWWEDIFNWYDSDTLNWDLINSVLADLFAKPPYWRTCSNMMRAALTKAPIDMAEKWANDMLNQNVDINKKQDIYPIIYNAALVRNELKEIALRFLKSMEGAVSQAKETEYNRILLNCPNEKAKLKDSAAGKKYRIKLIEEYIEYTQFIVERKSIPDPFTLGGKWHWGNYWRVYKRLNWSKLKEDEWNSIHKSTESAIKKTPLLEDEFLILITIWGIIAHQQKQSVIDKAAEWLLNEVLPLQIKPSQIYDPIDPFSYFDSNSLYAKAIGVSFLLPHASSKNLGQKMLTWIQEQIPGAEERYLPSFWDALLRLYIRGEHSISLWALNALKAVYARIASNIQLMTEAIERTYEIFLYQDERKSKQMIEILKDNSHEDILILLDNAISRLIITAEPNARRAAAQIVSIYEKMKWMNKQRSIWKEKLKNDPRARVFRVFD